MSRNAIALLACSLLCACSESGTDSAAQADTNAGATTVPGLRLNEIFVASNSVPEAGEDQAPWIEIVNSGPSIVRLTDFVLKTDQDSWEMPDVNLEPGEIYVLNSLVSTNSSVNSLLPEDMHEISLVDKDGQVLDHVGLAQLLPDESFARFPNGVGEFSVYAEDQVTPGNANPDIGFVRKVASKTEFRPRDSSPNAILKYDGYFWILGGWSNFAHDVWYSYTDVWRSRDAVDWELVNEAPPYIHYCSYVVWQKKMWAIGPSSFSSVDGIEWNPEALQAAASSRSVVFRDMLVNVNGSAVRGTRDGTEWITLNSAPPWGATREELVAVVHGGKIWVMGGIADYGTSSENIHNDVWNSSDGVNWNLITPGAEWSPRIWSSAVSYDNKIFLFNGNNRNLWPDEFGNTAEIWFTSDGVDWFELKSESMWEARHASYLVVDRAENNIVLLAGYGHGGVSRIHNDAWKMRVSIFFPKPGGDLSNLRTWGKGADGRGRSPESFDADYQVFILRNRTAFSIDERLSVTGAGSRIVVGDGDRDNGVVLEIFNDGRASHPLYLSANSTTFATGQPKILFKDPDALLHVQ